MKLKNTSKDDVVIASLDLTCKPGEMVEVEDAYCQPRKTAQGESMEPVIKGLAPQLEPEGGWEKAMAQPVVPKPPEPVTAGKLEESGMAPGLAELMAEPVPVPTPESSSEETAPAKRGRPAKGA